MRPRGRCPRAGSRAADPAGRWCPETARGPRAARARSRQGPPGGRGTHPGRTRSSRGDSELSDRRWMPSTPTPHSARPWSAARGKSAPTTPWTAAASPAGRRHRRPEAVSAGAVDLVRAVGERDGIHGESADDPREAAHPRGRLGRSERHLDELLDHGPPGAHRDPRRGALGGLRRGPEIHAGHARVSVPSSSTRTGASR